MNFLTKITVYLLLAVMVRTCALEPVRVDGRSMQNTLMNGEIVLVSKTAYGKGTEGMTRGDIVLCHYPNREGDAIHLNEDLSLDHHVFFVKRLVALPGDTVEIRKGILYVNGMEVPDPEKMGSKPGDYPLRTLGEDEYFVIGDNRSTSHDSRSADVGPLSRDMIVGKVTQVIFPVDAQRIVK